ncbi:MAG: hypothetical protein ACKO0M_06340 [Cyanobium sp.]
MPATPPLSDDDRRRICEALRYMGRDLHHRSFAVAADRRELLWQEMDRCLALADRLAAAWADPPSTPAPPAGSPEWNAAAQPHVPDP